MPLSTYQFSRLNAADIAAAMTPTVSVTVLAFGFQLGEPYQAQGVVLPGAVIVIPAALAKELVASNQVALV